MLKRHCAIGKTPLLSPRLCNRALACQSAAPPEYPLARPRPSFAPCASRAADPVANAYRGSRHRGVLARNSGGVSTAIILGVNAIGAALPLFGHSTAWLAASALVFGVSFFAVVGSTTAFVRFNYPPAAWPTAIAAMTIAFGVGHTLGPTATGAITDALGEPVLRPECRGGGCWHWLRLRRRFRGGWRENPEVGQDPLFCAAHHAHPGNRHKIGLSLHSVIKLDWRSAIVTST